MSKVKEIVAKYWKIVAEFLIFVAIGGLVVYILIERNPAIFDKSDQPLRVITHKELDVWYSLDGKIILVDKNSGGTKILSDSLATDIMLTKLKFYYTEELRKAGKLSEIDNINTFFKKKP